MSIFANQSFTEAAQKRLAGQREKLEQARAALSEGNLLSIDSAALPRRVGRLISNPLIRECLEEAEPRSAVQPSVIDELKAYASLPLAGAPTEAARRLNALSPQTRTQLEAIIGGNDLLPIWFLDRGAELRRTVARIKVVTSDGAESFGTGFLIGPGILLTNRHVLDQSDLGKDSLHTIVASAVVEFDVEVVPKQTPTGQLRFSSQRPVAFSLAPETLLLTDAWDQLDYVLIALERKSMDGQHDISEYGYNRLAADLGKTVTGEPVFIIQHPNGESKKISLLNNRMMIRDENSSYLYYEADTEPGSSGSPVFNRQWEVVALHHSVEFARDSQDRILARDGSVWRSEMGAAAIKTMNFNEGVRISRILKQLEAKRESMSPGPTQPPLESMNAAGRHLLNEVLATAHQAPIQDLLKPVNVSEGGPTRFPTPD